MDYEKLMDSRNHQNDFTNYLGIKTIKMSEGYAEGEVTIKPCSPAKKILESFSKVISMLRCHDLVI